MLTTGIVQRVIDLGSAIEDYWDGGVRDVYPTYPLVGPDGKEPPRPPEEDELRQYLRSLPPEDVYYLLATVKLAWGNFHHTEFNSQLGALEKEVKLEDAIERLVRTTYLTADLIDGLRIQRHPDVDVDVRALKFTTV